MLDGKYMTMPGIDKIGGGRATENFYKVVSSSAQNWDHHHVMSETFGDMGNLPLEQMYQIAVEQYTKGITHLIPHAVWYNDQSVTFLPELSWRNPLYNKGIPAFNTFLARMQYMLDRPGRNITDIAMVYPIQTLQAGHQLDGPLGYYAGGVEVPGTDYDMVSAILTDQLGCDFTYLHPEVIDDRCTVGDGGVLTMHNAINTQHFTTIILPGMNAISLSNLQRIQQACLRGALIIFTTQTPSLSADNQASNEQIQEITHEMIASGRAIFLPNPTAEALKEALAQSPVTPDVSFIEGSQPVNYLHKQINDQDVYFFGNIDNTMAQSTIQLRDNIGSAVLMDPRTGEVTPATLAHRDGHTILQLALAPTQSVFLVPENAVGQNGSDLQGTPQGRNYSFRSLRGKRNQDIRAQIAGIFA